MEDFYKSYYNNDDRVRHLIDCLNDNGNIACPGLYGSSKAFVLNAVFSKMGGKHFVICGDKEKAAYFYNDLENILNERDMDYSKKRILFYPTSYKRPYEPEKADNTYILSRTEVLQRVSVNDIRTVIVSYPEALAEMVVQRDTLENNAKVLSVGDIINMDNLTDALLDCDFEHADFVVEPGQFAIRGGIVDVFSFANDFPYRIEFMSDEIDSIRSFNPANQLSIEKLDKIVIMPNLQEMKSSYHRVSIMDYLDRNSVIWVEEGEYLAERVNAEYDKALKIYESFEEKDNTFDRMFCKGYSIIEKMSSFKTVSFGSYLDKKDKEVVTFNIIPQPVFNKNFDLLLADLEKLKADDYKVFCFSESKKQLNRIQSILNDIRHIDDSHNDFFPVLYSIQAGFVDIDLKICCYTDHQIFERYHRFHIRDGYANSQAITIKELYNLKPGDFVTHIDHGIGRFDGLETITNNGKQQEALRLIYQNGDILYVSIHSLHRIAKYSGKDGAEPALSKLGSNAWNRLKNKTKSHVKDIARELIKLYAERKNSKGYQFMPDSYLQTELEATFMYEDTPDQLKATLDVKHDMESEAPMDRLVCGDVGFGKTEVAIRAAFKAVCDSKQVAVLVPTTVLALQHYHTFSNRLKGFPVNVDYLNRFKTVKEQKKTLEDLASGKVDILIGTHRILGKDVKFKDLGLLVIDEEQKFGVSAKEKLKQLKTNVDTLTMTATPIPRTLQFSMMGARDMSIITTSPPNRYPVETQCHVFNPEVIRDAIQYELARDGQVFFVHNRVQNIQDVYDMIVSYVPGVKIAVGHGQMEGDKLEKIMLDFIDGKYDVLLCTTIIEAGLDIPNANTIIINEAQRFGLSDLHQLRGRVGRSNKKAFCYLLTPPMPMLNDEAQKRLRAIEEFSDLGSGFNIALRDLDIRGAGNLLGAEQSGFINDIGFETYHHILDEAILELKETEFKDLFEPQQDKKFVSDCVIESDMEILLPPEYVESSTERVSLYTELDHIQNEEGLQRFVSQITDRFGTPPRQTIDLVDTVRLRWMARDLGFEKIVLKNGVMTCYFVANQESGYYSTDMSMNIIRYVTENARFFKIKEVNDKVLLYVKNVDSVSKAMSVLAAMLKACN